MSKINTHDVLKIIAAGAIIVATPAIPALPMILTESIKAWKGIKSRDLGKIIKRLEKQEMLAIREEGNITIITITDKGEKRLLAYDYENLERKAKKRDGKWRLIIFDIPEGKKKNRDAFRRKLLQLDCIGLQDSVFVSAFPCKEEVNFLCHYLEISDYVSIVVLDRVERGEQLLLEIEKFVEKDDIVVEGSNANFKDTQRRYEHFTKKGIRFLGTGVAGGIHGPSLGYAIMAGGDKSAYDHITPILDTLVKPTAAHGYFGTGGAGHFVKMIHNGIEYGYMQAIGEGFDVLEHSPYKPDLLKVARLWQKSSLISGFMMDRTVESLEKDPHMEQLQGIIDATGEAQWTVDTAKELGIPVEIIEASLEYRRRSKIDTKIQNSYTAKMVAALRNAFGAHAVQQKKKE